MISSVPQAPSPASQHDGQPALSSAPLVLEPLTDFSKAPAREALRGPPRRGWPDRPDLRRRRGERTPSRPCHLRLAQPVAPDQVVGRCAVRPRSRRGRPSPPPPPPSPPGATPRRKQRATTCSGRRRSCAGGASSWRPGRSTSAASTWREADADVAEAIDFCDFYAREMLRLAAPRTRDVPGEENVYFYEPRGVAVVIAPWNFPLAILCGMTTAALVTGNTVDHEAGRAVVP